MSAPSFIFTISGALQTMLHDDTGATVLLESPDQQPSSGQAISLWLYQVAENEFTKNQPLLRTSTPGQSALPPLTLNLYYLLTPFGAAAQSQDLLGKAMRSFYDNAVVFVRSAAGDTEELRISLCRLTLEELTRVWEALQKPYRLSVCYEVQVTHIDSVRTTGGARVLERAGGFRDSTVEEVA